MNILFEIEDMGREMKSPRNDGFTTLYYKQKLLLIKQAVEIALENAPHHVGEDEWIAENIKTKETI
jgi:hypothetical protein